MLIGLGEHDLSSREPPDMGLRPQLPLGGSLLPRQLEDSSLKPQPFPPPPSSPLGLFAMLCEGAAWAGVGGGWGGVGGRIQSCGA